MQPRSAESTDMTAWADGSSSESSSASSTVVLGRAERNSRDERMRERDVYITCTVSTVFFYGAG